jgi:hypothetical protein
LRSVDNAFLLFAREPDSALVCTEAVRRELAPSALGAVRQELATAVTPVAAPLGHRGELVDLTATLRATDVETEHRIRSATLVFE